MDILNLAAQAASASWFADFFGQIQTIEAILLVLGLLFLVAEIFMPGFGFAGGTGIVLIIVAIFLTARTPLEAFLMFLVLVVLVVALILILLRSARKGQIARRLILRQSATREKGFSSAKDYSFLVGKAGTTVTPLRPAGIALIDGKRYDVVTEGGFVTIDTPVLVSHTQGYRIVVVPIAQANNI